MGSFTALNETTTKTRKKASSDFIFSFIFHFFLKFVFVGGGLDLTSLPFQEEGTRHFLTSKSIYLALFV